MSSNTALTQEMECSDCMLGSQVIELNSPFGYQSDLASNFSASTSSCGKSGYSINTPAPYVVKSNLTPSATANPTASAVAFRNASSTTQGCNDPYTVKDGDTCNSIAIAHNVSTFSLLYENNLQAYCQSFPASGSDICLPAQCDIYTVQANQTCWDVVQAQASGITLTQIQAWNNNVNLLCGNLDDLVGSQICVR